MTKIRLNVQVSEESKLFVEKMATQLGISQSGFINLAIFQYKQDYEVDLVIADVKSRLDKIEELNKKDALSKNNNV